MDRWRRHQWIVMLSGGVAAYVLCLLRIQNLWWFEDDPYLQANAAHRSLPWAFFTSREALSKGLVGLLFTPLQNVTYWIDARLAPGSAGFAHAHTAVSLWAATLLGFLVLRRWLGATAAYVVVVLALLMPATVVIGEFISVRNYLDGLCLALAGIWLAQRAAKTSGRGYAGLAAGAALLCFLAGLAKELYITTPFALVAVMFLSRRRWLGVFLFVCAGVGYLAYYRAMIGSWSTTFGVPRLTLAEYPQFLWRYPYVFAGSPAGWILAFLTGAAVAHGIWSHRIDWAQVGLALAFVGIGLASMYPAAWPLSATYDARGTWYRVSFVSSLVILAASAWLVMKLPRSWRVVIAAIAILSLAPGTWLTVRAWDENTQRYRMEGRFYLDNPGKLLYSELPAWWFLVGLDDMYHVPERHYLIAARPNQPGDAALLEKYPTVWRYVPSSRVFAPASDVYAQLTGSDSAR